MSDSSTTIQNENREKIREIISSALFIPVEKIHDDDRIAAMNGMDSLTFSNIIVEIESIAGKNLDPSELIQIRTVSDLMDLAEKKS